MVMSEISSSREVSFVIILVLLVILLLLTILTLYMAVMLIRGSNNKNPRQINIWIIYAKILLVIYAEIEDSEKALVA
ncbi:unnamed protein product [Allacma fusca]|uniref:Uncharacterized protein n=1 Tax=Allacma fusca TaxID=39272 RepID=A0A8J2KNQ5_9HEXA|nr:unnamed protein product [Allacma fusca]